MEKTIVIKSEAGIHARPASIFVKEAVSASADIYLIKDGKEYNGKSIMSILGMGATKGTKLVLRVVGEGESELINKLSTILDEAV